MSERLRCGGPLPPPGCREPFAWAESVTPPGMFSLRWVAILFGVGRHQARRRFLASGYPGRLIRRAWTDPATGVRYARKTWVLPAETVGLLVMDAFREQRQRAGLDEAMRRLGISLPVRWRVRRHRFRRALAAKWGNCHGGSGETGVT